MKTVKKICLGFSAFLAFFIFTLVFSPAHKALAAPQKSDVQQCAKTLRFKNISQITCQLGSGKITFVDNNPTDQNYDHIKDYIASSGDYADESSSGAFCLGNTDYLNFNGGNFHISSAGSKQSAALQLYYVEPGKTGCQSFAQNVTITDTSGIAILLTGGKDQASSLPDVDSSSHSLSGQSFTRYQAGAFDPKKGVALYASGIDDLESSCDGEILAVYYSGSSGATATEYDISGGGKSLSSFSNLAKLPKDTGCGVDKENFGLDNGAFKLSPAVTQISGSLLGQKCGAGQAVPNGYDCQCTHDESGNSCVLVPGSSTTSADQQSGTGKLDSETSCEGNSSGFPLSWALCPVLDAASSLSGTLVSLFEDQLSFKVSDLGSASQAANGRGEVRTSWSLIRDIASSLLIVIMLVMVLSQAVSFGPFDAYTIKKLLPKMVVAIIIMQVSWDVFSWVVGIFDDIGHGLTNLMYVPFGGVGSMSLQHLLGHAGLSGAGGDATLGTLDWAAIGAGLALGYAYVFAMLGMATVAIISVLAGLFTLIFRKILIIMLLILSPLALVAWILPGTASYWKMWRENFIKALSMFPIAVGIIAAGRIFAQVAGTQDNGTLIALIFVLVGFFGPLFILPKTFKWGGQAMQMAGGGIQKAGSKIAERPKKLFEKRQEQWNGIRAQRSQMRVMEHGTSLKKGWSWNPYKSAVRAVDLMSAGKLDPTRLGQMQSDAENAYIEAGEKRQGERRAAAAQRWQRSIEEQIDESAGVTKDEVYQAMADHRDITFRNYNGEEVTIKGSDVDDLDVRVALDRLAVLGGAQNLRFIEKKYEEAMRSGDTRHASEFRGFLNDNVQGLLPKMTHLYKGYSSTADASPDAISQMHGVEIEAMLAEYSHRIATGTDSRGNAVDVERARGELNQFLSSYAEAAADPQLRGRLEAGGLRAVTAFVGGNPADALLTHDRTGIQGGARISRNGEGMQYTDREAGTTHGLTTIDPTVAASVLNPALSAGLQTHVVSRVRGSEDTTPEPEGEEMRISHEDIHTPGAAGTSGVTPYQEAQLQNELVDFRRRIAGGGTLSAAEQQRFEQIRRSFPHL